MRIEPDANFDSYGNPKWMSFIIEGGKPRLAIDPDTGLSIYVPVEEDKMMSFDMPLPQQLRIQIYAKMAAREAGDGYEGGGEEF